MNFYNANTKKKKGLFCNIVRVECLYDILISQHVILMATWVYEIYLLSKKNWRNQPKNTINI